jgi:two-component system CitB family response regulator
MARTLTIVSGARWDVLIATPDAASAAQQCRLVASVPDMRPVGVATTGARAGRLLETLQPSLLLLDLDLSPAREESLALLRRIRARNAPIEVIAASSAPTTSVVRAALHLGAIDFLLTPATPGRISKSLGVFRRHMAMLAQPVASQREVDELCSNGPNARRWIPRDLSAARLDRVREALVDAGRAITVAEVAGQLGIAQATARRYLEYLVTIGDATGDREITGPGRPRNTYMSACAEARSRQMACA